MTQWMGWLVIIRIIVGLNQLKSIENIIQMLIIPHSVWKHSAMR